MIRIVLFSDAINASENNTIKICDVPPTGVTVQRGHTLDGLGKYYRATIEESDEEPVDVVQTLKDARVDVAAFKQRYGITRKFAIPLLEYLDRERVTRRVGDSRVVL